MFRPSEMHAQTLSPVPLSAYRGPNHYTVWIGTRCCSLSRSATSG